ncbi:N-acetylmuramoyl-L-alanine amidase family protein [Staphylococcus massiliensis]|uniref:peptidoglycan recognition protein family protein n=1 Tax=Staphylococcus massiliensis TaxID=555791 RepID=UPI00370D1B7A
MTKTFIGEWNGIKVYQDYLPFGTRRSGERLSRETPLFMVFHDTGNIDATAQNNIDYYRNTYNIEESRTASAHVFVDDKECVICVPFQEKAWHVLYNVTLDNKWYQDNANDVAIGIEACYFNDVARTKQSFENTCKITAYLCDKWGINPYTHLPGHQQLQADKQDPGNILEKCGYHRNDMKVIYDKVSSYMKMNDYKENEDNDVEFIAGAMPPCRYPAHDDYVCLAISNDEGVTICEREGESWIKTQKTYGGYQLFYIYEIVDGWCRVYDHAANYWVWHERLKVISE